MSKYIGFCVYRRSYLICPPAIVHPHPPPGFSDLCTLISPVVAKSREIFVPAGRKLEKEVGESGLVSGATVVVPARGDLRG